MSRIERFFRLPSEEQRLVVEATFLLLGVYLALRVVSFRRIEKWACAPSGSEHPPVEEQHDWAERVSWCIGVAAAHLLLPVRCLEKSVTLLRMIRRRNVWGELRIGVAVEKNDIAAHAWVELEGRPVNEPVAVGEGFSTLLPATDRQGSTFESQVDPRR